MQEQAVPNRLVVLGPGLGVTMPAWTDRMPVLEASPRPQFLFSMLTRNFRSSQPDPTPPALDLLLITSHCPSLCSLSAVSRRVQSPHQRRGSCPRW